MDSGASRPVRVLIVDDEPEVLRSLRAVLERHGGVEVMSAPSAEDALPLVERWVFDVVISDYSMGGMSGAAFLGRVRELRPGTSRMLITAHQEMEVALEAINLGHAHAFMSKPWSARDLLLRVDALVAARREEAQQRGELARSVMRAARVVSVAGGRASGGDSGA